MKIKVGTEVDFLYKFVLTQWVKPTSFLILTFATQLYEKTRLGSVSTRNTLFEAEIGIPEFHNCSELTRKDVTMRIYN